MKKWQKGAIAFSVAAALALPITLPAIHVADAAPKKSVQHVDAKDRVTLQQTKVSAVTGKTINSENFGVGSSTKDIIKKWGKPTNGSDDSYLYYNNRNIEFTAVKGKVTGVYSHDKRFNTISYQEVLSVYGKPVAQSNGSDAVYADYKAGKHKLTLAFFYDKTGKKPSTLKNIIVK